VTAVGAPAVVGLSAPALAAVLANITLGEPQDTVVAAISPAGGESFIATPQTVVSAACCAGVGVGLLYRAEATAQLRARQQRRPLQLVALALLQVTLVMRNTSPAQQASQTNTLMNQVGSCPAAAVWLLACPPPGRLEQLVSAGQIHAAL